MRIDELGDITDPLQRAQQAQKFVVAAREQMEQAQTVRDDAVAALLDDGMSVRKLATILNLSPSRVQQVRKP